MKEINDNIAHDLRSPLARIRGIAEMTLVSEKTVDDYQDMAASTVEECDSLIDMINTMLDITEAEAGVNGTQEKVIPSRHIYTSRLCIPTFKGGLFTSFLTYQF